MTTSNPSPNQRAVLARYGWPWFGGYVPTIIIERRREGDRRRWYTPSVRSVTEAQRLRRACLASGIGYWDGWKHVGGEVADA